MFLDFSQNEYRAETQIFSHFLASPQVKELQNDDNSDTSFIRTIAERFHHTYLYDKNTCENIVLAYAWLTELIDKETFEKGLGDKLNNNILEKDLSDQDNMVLINGGTFLMGSPDDEPGRGGIFSNERQHQVTINSFLMGIYNVTQKEYYNVIGINPSHFKGDNLPVENISWFDTIIYCNKLSQIKGLHPVYNINGYKISWEQNANGYRLPTEAEWEYACRAGTTTPFNTGFNITIEQANFNNNITAGGIIIPDSSQGISKSKNNTTQVGSYASNSWGLFDMHGNVWEWCWDLYEKNYHKGNQINPKGHDNGKYRIIRGGSYLNSKNELRSACRYYNEPLIQKNIIGFRIVRNA